MSSPVVVLLWQNLSFILKSQINQFSGCGRETCADSHRVRLPGAASHSGAIVLDRKSKSNLSQSHPPAPPNPQHHHPNTSKLIGSEIKLFSTSLDLQHCDRLRVGTEGSVCEQSAHTRIWIVSVGTTKGQKSTFIIIINNYYYFHYFIFLSCEN